MLSSLHEMFTTETDSPSIEIRVRIQDPPSKYINKCELAVSPTLTDRIQETAKKDASVKELLHFIAPVCCLPLNLKRNADSYHQV